MQRSCDVMLLIVFWCRYCAAPPELILRLPVALSLDLERMAIPIVAIVVATCFHQSIAALASPDLLDRSTTNQWRRSSPSPCRFCNSSPRNPYYIFSGSSRSFLVVVVAIYFLALLSPLPRSAGIMRRTRKAPRPPRLPPRRRAKTFSAFKKRIDILKHKFKTFLFYHISHDR